MSKDRSKNQLDAAKDEAATPTVYFLGELNEGRWSVVTFEKCVARGLTYDAAFRKMEALAGQNHFGLCVLTDEAASRISERAKR